MRVLLVSRELSPFYGGGIGTYAAEMSRVFEAAGHEVHLLTAPHDGLHERSAQSLPGVRIHTVDLDAGLAALEAYPTYPMRYAMAVYERVSSLTDQALFDYIEFPDYHAEGYFCIRAKRTLGRLSDAVLAVRLHSTSFICREADGEYRLDAEMATIEHMERDAIAAADLLIAPARGVLDRAPRPSHAAQQRTVIPIPFDTDALIRTFGGSKTDHASPTEPTVLFFGKLQNLKGPDLFVDAAQLLLRRGRRARFQLIGNDSPTAPFGRSMLQHLERRIPKDLRASFEFLPARPRPELGEAIRSATVCCFPSRWESFPMVCLEAMALGAPVIGTDVGGLGAIIEHERSGLLAAPENAEALAAAIDRLLGDQSLRTTIAAAAPARVRALCDPRRILGELSRATADTRSAARPFTPPPHHPITPSVSIIIPHYNLGKYLPDTVASARAQTFRDLEIIVVDDGSTDPASIAALDQLPADVRVIRKPNGGLGSARNAGLQAARGRWVVPLDADDIIDPTLIEKVVAAAHADSGLAYISPLVAYFTDDPAEATGGWIPLGLDPDLLAVMNVGGAASGTLIDREQALAVGGWDEAMPAYEDWDFWCRLHDAGARGTVIPEFLLRYRVRANSMYRTELSRHVALHSYILKRHPRLINERSARILASRTVTDPRAEVDRLIAENVRYRIADRLNDALKKAGVQRAIKGVARRVAGSERP
jgi:glycosyltransferase involved in cell wall biosynthesis